MNKDEAEAVLAEFHRRYQVDRQNLIHQMHIRAQALGSYEVAYAVYLQELLANVREKAK